MASDLSKFFKDRQVIILLIFLLISIGSIAFLGVEQGLDLKGGSSIQLQLEHPVNDSTMKIVTSVLDLFPILNNSHLKFSSFILLLSKAVLVKIDSLKESCEPLIDFSESDSLIDLFG